MASYPRHLVGVDFSGAADAGDKTWITDAYLEDGLPTVRRCYPARNLDRSSQGRDGCLDALRHFIASQHECVVGLDFPFSLPRMLIREATWEDFVLGFEKQYANADAFRGACRSVPAPEHKRKTDVERHTPWSPYNLRLYRQTYFGIARLLAPLVRDRAACALPMQEKSRDKPWLVEVCPACSLGQYDTKMSYKGRGQDRRDARARILSSVLQRGPVCLPQNLRPMIIDDLGGDALDSVVAAVAAFHAVRLPLHQVVTRDIDYAMEGYVFI